jgi:hypothetical protein
MKCKKVLLVQLPSGEINFIPLEPITGVEIIKPNEKLAFWVYEKTNPGGASDFIGDEHVVRDLSPEDIKTINANNNECYVEVDYEDKLSMPSNMLGNKKVVLHLQLPKEAEVLQ